MLRGLVFPLVPLSLPWVTFLRLLLLQQILGSVACLLLERQRRWYTLMHREPGSKDQAWAETSARFGAHPSRRRGFAAGVSNPWTKGPLMSLCSL